MYILIHVKFNAAEGTKFTVTVEIVHSAVFRVIFCLDWRGNRQQTWLESNQECCIWLLWHLTYLNRA